MGTKTVTAQRNTSHYWDTIIFQVEDELFKVPRYYFETHSPIFQLASSLPLEEGHPIGQDDDHPVVLESIKKVDFSALLRFMYPVCNDVFRISGTTSRRRDFTLSEWISILHLSTMWELREVRKLAIANMDSESKNFLLGLDVQRAELARTYGVPPWFITAYVNLVGQLYSEGALQDGQVTRLGWETSYRLSILALKRARAKSAARPVEATSSPKQKLSVNSTIAHAQSVPSPLNLVLGEFQNEIQDVQRARDGFEEVGGAIRCHDVVDHGEPAPEKKPISGDLII